MDLFVPLHTGNSLFFIHLCCKMHPAQAVVREVRLVAYRRCKSQANIRLYWSRAGTATAFTEASFIHLTDSTALT
jgi:hypothetical protein